MFFRVFGAESVTGRDIFKLIEATSEAEAVKKAKESSLFPYKVVRDVAAEATEMDRLAEERRGQNAVAEHKERLARVRAIKATLSQRVARGTRPRMFQSVFVPVDSTALGNPLAAPFTVRAIAAAGLEGWEVVGVVPRTMGMGLSNKEIVLVGGILPASGNVSWAGGLGGNVSGVYLVLQREIAQDDITDDDNDAVSLYVRAYL